MDKEVKAAQERADMLNNTKLSEAATKQQINEIKKVGIESYLSYQENKFVVNDMVASYSFTAIILLLWFTNQTNH